MDTLRNWAQKYFIIITILVGVGSFVLAGLTYMALGILSIVGASSSWIFLPLAIYLAAVCFLAYILKTPGGSRFLILILVSFLSIALVVALSYLRYQNEIGRLNKITELESYLPQFASSTSFLPQSLCFSLKNLGPDVVPHELWALELSGVVIKPTFTDSATKTIFNEVMEGKFRFDPFRSDLGEGEGDEFNIITPYGSVDRLQINEATENIIAISNFYIDKNLGIKDYGSLRIIIGYQVIGSSQPDPRATIGSIRIPEKIIDALRREQLGNFSKEEKVCENLVPPFSYTPASTAAPQNLNSIFDLSEKETGTRLYYSDKLGVGFTYVPNQAGTPAVEVTEIGDKIYVHYDNEKPEQGKSIEIFTKDPNLTLEEAIRAKFLTGYNSSDCFVKTYEASQTGLPNYISAGISFPRTNDPSIPWWQNADKCPQNYRETNGGQFFLMNKDVPGKLLFVILGQDSITSDGTPKTAEGGFDWSHSIRILK